MWSPTNQCLSIRKHAIHIIHRLAQSSAHALRLVMGIGNIFKIDDRYINIDR